MRDAYSQLENEMKSLREIVEIGLAAGLIAAGRGQDRYCCHAGLQAG